MASSTAWKCFLGFILGFSPMAGIYVSIPVPISMGLGWFPAFFWGALGTYLILPFVHFLYHILLRFPSIKTWHDRQIASKWHAHIVKYGGVVILLAAPFIGFWTIGIIMKALAFDKIRYFVFPAISLIFYGVLIALVSAYGYQYFQSVLPFLNA